VELCTRQVDRLGVEGWEMMAKHSYKVRQQGEDRYILLQTTIETGLEWSNAQLVKSQFHIFSSFMEKLGKFIFAICDTCINHAVLHYAIT
jgi:hypothetical protein